MTKAVVSVTWNTFQNSFQWPTSHRRRQKAASIDFSPKSIFNLETAAAAEIKDYYSCTLSHECVAKHILVRTTDIQGKRHWKMLSGSYHKKALKLLLTLALGIFYFWTVCVYFFELSILCTYGTWHFRTSPSCIFGPFHLSSNPSLRLMHFLSFARLFRNQVYLIYQDIPLNWIVHDHQGWHISLVSTIARYGFKTMGTKVPSQPECQVQTPTHCRIRSFFWII